MWRRVNGDGVPCPVGRGGETAQIGRGVSDGELRSRNSVADRRVKQRRQTKIREECNGGGGSANREGSE